MQLLLTSLFSILYAATVIGVVLVIIAGNRNPLKAAPWVLFVLFAPVVGLFFYFFFGQDLRRQRFISRRTYKRIMVYSLPARVRRAEAPVPDEYKPMAAMLEKLSHATPFHGSRLTAYCDGASKMEALLEEIERAQHHIHIFYYIVEPDEIGNRLIDALLRKAAEGVKVRLLYDDVGSKKLKKRHFRRMREGGIEVYPFLEVRFPLFTRKMNYRNHRKVVVIDGRIGFFGGMNIADRYIAGPKWGGTWRDNHFKIEGKGVYGLQSVFLVDWSTVSQIRVDSAEFFPDLSDYTEGVMQFVPSGPYGPWRSLLQAVMLAVAAAKERIWIQTPYFLPTEGLNMLLQTAALSGIDVQLMLPKHSDSWYVGKAMHSFIDDMVRSGVRVWFYKSGFLHAKLLVVDDELTICGSANMDFRSFEHNFESNAFVYDRSFNEQMQQTFIDDLRACERLKPVRWFRRPWPQRLAESFMRLFSPLM